MRRRGWIVAAALLGGLAGCGGPDATETVITVSTSALGAEARLLRRQLHRFTAAHPTIRVVERPTPDAADQRHQLYVQWLNARAPAPDLLQLDVIWTPEFAAAGWIVPLDEFAPDVAGFFPSAITANRWRGRLYALPWFIDVGMLYYRTDLVPRAPTTFAELARLAAAARGRGGTTDGLVWQGARYEGLVATYLEHLGGFGGRILDDDGRVRVDEAAAVRALTFMRDAVRDGPVPAAALTWREEQARLVNTYPGLVLPYLTFAMPLAVWLLVGFFRQLPREIEEAALVDGASRLAVLRRIVLPLAAPGLAATAILTFVYCWNEFLFALSFTVGPERQTVPVAIALFRGQYQVPWGQVLAAATLATVPVWLLVLLAQRHIVRGLTAGALKQ